MPPRTWTLLRRGPRGRHPGLQAGEPEREAGNPQVLGLREGRTLTLGHTAQHCVQVGCSCGSLPPGRPLEHWPPFICLARCPRWAPRGCLLSPGGEGAAMWPCPLRARSLGCGRQRDLEVDVSGTCSRVDAPRLPASLAPELSLSPLEALPDPCPPAAYLPPDWPSRPCRAYLVARGRQKLTQQLRLPKKC